MLLEETTNYFDRAQLEREQMAQQYLNIANTNGPPTESRPRSRFGFAPWHLRRNSSESLMSVSSSVHRLLMGKTPMGTPIPEAQYGGQQGRRYTRGRSVPLNTSVSCTSGKNANDNGVPS